MRNVAWESCYKVLAIIFVEAMDADRKSTVSSFYGGRKSSIDPLNALNTEYPTEYPPQPAVRGRDDASSFFSPGRSSMDHLTGARSSAGYNRNSFFHVGREEPLKGGRDEEKDPREDAWDVYADFNNAGPRYSSVFGMSQSPAVGYFFPLMLLCSSLLIRGQLHSNRVFGFPAQGRSRGSRR